ncbi:hypothetical protein J2S43_004183 [Catenuloplanes nepalensis]|uniref:Uncharacterized protein n=1 Tax=Catenuloplanes nepalensis TaxID=587533 RepID=A0ABT9MW54_9ACTN|nr:hypothetical protein [Catenuloplanes nepalensis]
MQREKRYEGSIGGGGIVVDRTGYHSIGDWVSAYRIR